MLKLDEPARLKRAWLNLKATILQKETDLRSLDLASGGECYRELSLIISIRETMDAEDGKARLKDDGTWTLTT